MATIRDIARQAGVSVATVSRTLRDPETVRPVTRERVRAVIAEMNYSPNAIARQLRQRTNETVIVIVPAITNPFFAGIVQSIENVAMELGYRVLLGETQGSQERLDHYAEMVLTRIADGLILLGSLLPSIVRAGLAAGGAPPIPLVLACEPFEGLECPNVLIDNVAASQLAVRHLAERGCRRIATITGPLLNTLCQDRLTGYRQGIAEAGLAGAEWVVQGDFSIESGYTAMQSLLAGSLRPDGVFCASDEMAIGALKAIHERELSIPGDIAVIGFDDLRFGAFAAPPLSTIRQPTTELGSTAMRLLDDVIHGRAGGKQAIVLPHELVARASTLGDPREV